MEYEPFKRRLNAILAKRVFLRRVFYFLLDMVFLRTWYVKRAVRRLGLDASGAHRFLDAGAGFGQYSAFLCRRFRSASILGADIDAGLVESGNAFAERTGWERLHFEVADLTRMEYTDAFDLILCVDVIEHVEEDEVLLSRFAKALKPEGRLVLSTPTTYRMHGEDGAFVEEHARPGYSEGALRTKAARAGLEIISLEYAYGFWGDLAWRLGIRNTMRLVGRGWHGSVIGMLNLVLLMPVCLVMMWIDFVHENPRGTGFVMTAAKAE